MFKKGTSTRALSGPYLAWALIFIVVPLFMILYYGCTDDTGTFTLENIAYIARPNYLKSLVLALKLSLICTLVCFLLAYPLAMILAGRQLSHHGLIVTLFILPMWMNFLLRTMAWMTMLEKRGVLNAILSFLHLPNLQIINTPTAIVIGMVYNFLPFMVLPLYNSLSAIDTNVINAARDLGANPLQTFWKITLPLSTSGIISGITMVFIPALTTFAISNMLGGSKVLLVGNLIEQQFTVTYDWHLGSGLSIILMLFILLNMIISFISDSKEDKAA